MDQPESPRKTPLDEALKMGYGSLVMLLLKHGGRSNEFSTSSLTANYLNVLRRLRDIQKASNSSSSSSSSSSNDKKWLNQAIPGMQGAHPLHLVCVLRDPDTTHALLLLGANPNAVDTSGNRPIHVATKVVLDLVPETEKKADGCRYMCFGIGLCIIHDSYVSLKECTL